MSEAFGFYEFFAGGGMAREGLGRHWSCLFANDSSPIKARAYCDNWGASDFDGRDVHDLAVEDLPDVADLAWASFPCQDVSVAGPGHGIGDAKSSVFTRSGALWPFFELMKALGADNRKPPLLVLENVMGLLTLAGGRDFAAICARLSNLGYRYGGTVIDARHFVPQSRPRVFLVAVDRAVAIPRAMDHRMATSHWHPPVLMRAFQGLNRSARKDWIWWNLGEPPALPDDAILNSLSLKGADWNSDAETKRLLGMMTRRNLDRLDVARARAPMVGSLYLRMRPNGKRNMQRAEVAFGPTLGCLRTPRGGGSRPRIVLVERKRTRTRLLTAREAATLMGLSDDYVLPQCYEHAFQVIGDGVAVPVVAFLKDKLLEPLAAASRSSLKRMRRAG
jgi:DNA (cytosine-5)-methyltransferase 1